MFHHINLCGGTVGSASMTREQGDMRRFETWCQHLLNSNLVVSAETFVKDVPSMASPHNFIDFIFGCSEAAAL